MLNCFFSLGSYLNYKIRFFSPKVHLGENIASRPSPSLCLYQPQL